MRNDPEEPSVRQRLKRYLWLAEQARVRAEMMPTADLQDGYLKLAQDWRALAQGIERRTGWASEPRFRDRLGLLGSAEDSTA